MTPPSPQPLISAQDLQEAADHDLMLTDGLPDGMTAAEAVEALGLEPRAIGGFLRGSNFRWPHRAGVRHNLDPESIAYGICLGIVAERTRAQADDAMGRLYTAMESMNLELVDPDDVTKGMRAKQ